MLTHFFVNVPYDLLVKKYLPLFARQHLNPEIYFSPQILDKWPEDEFKAVAREVEQFDLKTTFHAPFYDLSLGSIEPKVRRVTQERLEQILSLADFFHPLSIVIHLSYDARIYEEHLEEWLENTVQTIGKIIPVAEKQKIYLNLENVFESEPNIFLLVLKRFTSNYIGICFDIGHIYAFTHTTLKDWEVVFPFIKQVHLHDNHGHKDEHLGLGKGKIDFMLLFSLFKKYQRYPILTLEPHTEKAFWDSQDYLQKLPEEIKTYFKKCPHLE